MTPFHDYAYYLMVIERNFKQLDDKCLHKNFDIDQNVIDIMSALSGLMSWVKDAKQK